MTLLDWLKTQPGWIGLLASIPGSAATLLALWIRWKRDSASEHARSEELDEQERKQLSAVQSEMFDRLGRDVARLGARVDGLEVTVDKWRQIARRWNDAALSMRHACLNARQRYEFELERQGRASEPWNPVNLDLPDFDDPKTEGAGQ